MEEIQHKILPVNGLKMHVAELGEGPLVLFVHGFPELWYSWRHQMVFMAARGYRAVAPDMRGYGDTTGAPLDDPSKFTVFHLVGDLISLLDAIAPNEDKVFVVGHDWGAYVAWHLCMYRPDRVKALVNLSVPFIPRDPQMNYVESLRKIYGDDHYMYRYQINIQAFLSSSSSTAPHTRNSRSNSQLAMEKIVHKTIPVNGLNMHVAELGQGPLILFIHGFPELWYSWRHQMVFMAARGYRAVAPDMRGYGDTTGAPLDDPSKFTVFHLVGDVVSLLDAIAPDEGKVFVVGHDWGAMVAWHLCLFRPDRVKALVNLSVPYFPRSPEMNTVEKMRMIYGDDHYICRFQEAGDIEGEFEKVGTKEVLKYFLSFRDPAPFFFPKGKGFGFSADRAPRLTEEDLDYFATKFEQTGFTGGVNYYRALGLDWELNAPWSGAGVKVAAKFIAGELDLVIHIPGTKDFIHKGEFKKLVPLLEDVVLLKGAAHFVNQERPDEINQLIYDFVKQF